LSAKEPEAIVIRTLPKMTAKLSRNTPHTNPPYLAEGLLFIHLKAEYNIADLTPSVDKEKDENEVAHNVLRMYGCKNLNACQIRPFYDNQNDFFFVVEGVVDGSYL
jgi:hypothetical protein